MTCSEVVDNLVLAIWNNAGDGINSIKNQPIKVKVIGTKKIVAKIINTTSFGDEFEVRGKDLYLVGSNVILQNGIPSDGSINTCLDGQLIGYAQDENFVKPQFYWKDNSVYKPFQKPVIQTSLSIQKNTTIIGKVFQYGNIKVYKNGVAYSSTDLTVNSTTLLFDFKPTEAGLYQFVLYNSNGISDLSIGVNVLEELKYDYIAPCIANCEIQFGVSKLDKDVNVVYLPSMGLIRLNSSGDVVESGGELYEHRVFNLAPGSWFFYFKEKNKESNIVIINKILL
jgi:hypothetical protein